MLMPCKEPSPKRSQMARGVVQADVHGRERSLQPARYRSDANSSTFSTASMAAGSGSSVRRLHRCAMGLSIALLTISDTRTLAEDSSGDQLQRSLEAAGHRLHERQLCPDDRYRIRAELSRWIADPAVDVVITSGGTGLTGRDGTPEAVAPLLDKPSMDSANCSACSPSKASAAAPCRVVASPEWPTAPLCLCCRDLWMP